MREAKGGESLGDAGAGDGVVIEAVLASPDLACENGGRTTSAESAKESRERQLTSSSDAADSCDVRQRGAVDAARLHARSALLDVARDVDALVALLEASDPARLVSSGADIAPRLADLLVHRTARASALRGGRDDAGESSGVACVGRLARVGRVARAVASERDAVVAVARLEVAVPRRAELVEDLLGGGVRQARRGGGVVLAESADSSAFV